MSEQYCPDTLERCCDCEFVRRVTDTVRYVLNQVEVSGPIVTGVFYECAKCGKRLRERPAREGE